MRGRLAMVLVLLSGCGREGAELPLLRVDNPAEPAVAHVTERVAAGDLAGALAQGP